MKLFFAHSGSVADTLDWQQLPDHLSQVAQSASERASRFGLSQTAYLAGLFHDLGKYDPAFQRKLAGEVNRASHSTAGAVVLLEQAQPKDQIPVEMVAYAILGHHAGLPDYNTPDGSSLQRRIESYQDQLDPVWRDQIKAPEVDLYSELSAILQGHSSKETGPFDISVATRMLFSCLVDADHRDAEAFDATWKGETKDRNWPKLQQILPQFTSAFNAHTDQLGDPTTDINKLRRDVLKHVRNNAAMSPGLFTLTVPTGGGKTLASLGFALEHAKMHGHQRIIYALPFTAIIDQTASIFRGILGDENVLEHHSAIEETKEERATEGRSKLRLAMEDWAAPVVVTTNVQLFESLFAARPGRARKLHNIAGSIIILDEAQTIPRPLLLPCLRMLDSMARLFKCSIVLCTATQPAVDAAVLKGGLALAGRELAPDPADLARRLRRVRISHDGTKDNAALVAALSGSKQGLIVVNSRVHALDLWTEARGLDGLYHLSTRQYAAHRRKLLTEIRERLRNGLPCRVISTSLIEAGVDISFPRAWRAEAGLEQIVQAAGRVNRNGEMLPELGQVTVFTPVGYATPPEIKGLIGDMDRMRTGFEDLQSPEAIRSYFSEVYWRLDKGLDKFDIIDSFKLVVNNTDFKFRTVAEKFRIIESGMVPVIIPKDANAISAVMDLAVRQIPSGKIARALQSYLVTVPPKARARMLACGKGYFANPDLRGDQFFVLEDMSLYHPETGLHWEDAEYLGTEAAII